MRINGILNVIKPRGKTSFQLVASIRRLSGERHIGHGGTLDPDASGVLPICLGQGTRVIQFLAEFSKTYLAEIQLGLSTDTYDSSGSITFKGDLSTTTREQVEQALSFFRGAIEQYPPSYSAVRYRGKHLYELARAGIEVEKKPRKVHILRLELVGWQFPCFTIEVECSSGTYIRSLAHDLGQSLGCGAFLQNLVRLQCGPFHIKNAISPPLLEEAFTSGYWRDLLYPLDEVLLKHPAIVVIEEQEQSIRQGHPLALREYLAGSLPSSLSAKRCRAYSVNGRFLALLSFDPQRGLWQPLKVFNLEN